MCALHEEFITHFWFNSSLPGVAQEKDTLPSNALWPHYIGALHAGTSRPQTGGERSACPVHGIIWQVLGFIF